MNHWRQPIIDTLDLCSLHLPSTIHPTHIERISVIKGWLGNDTSGAPPKPAGAVEHILNWTEQGTTITAQTAHGQATLVGSLGIPAQRPLFSGRGMQAKGRISAQIERDSLEDVFQIEDPITPAFQHLDPVIEPLHKATGVSISKVIGDPVHMLCQEL